MNNSFPDFPGNASQAGYNKNSELWHDLPGFPGWEQNSPGSRARNQVISQTSRAFVPGLVVIKSEGYASTSQTSQATLPSLPGCYWTETTSQARVGSLGTKPISCRNCNIFCSQAGNEKRAEKGSKISSLTLPRLPLLRRDIYPGKRVISYLRFGERAR